MRNLRSSQACVPSIQRPSVNRHLLYPGAQACYSKLVPDLKPVSPLKIKTKDTEPESLTAEKAEAAGSDVEYHSEPDKLYSKIIIEVKGHDEAVLKSYVTFTSMVAKELQLPKYSVYKLPTAFWRRAINKGAVNYKKHMHTYELRTYIRVIQFVNVTGSTLDTFLEYIQRNLPEGTAMKVTKTAFEELPPHLVPPRKEKPQKTQTS